MSISFYKKLNSLVHAQVNYNLWDIIKTRKVNELDVHEEFILAKL